MHNKLTQNKCRVYDFFCLEKYFAEQKLERLDVLLTYKKQI